MSTVSGTTSAPPVPPEGAAPVLEAVGLTKHFPVHEMRRRGLRRRRRVVHAVDDVSLTLRSGEVTALVGESGSGKSTIGRLLAGLYPATSGLIKVDGKLMRPSRGRRFRRYARQVQIIFQDPFGSLNPMHNVGYILARPLRIHGFARRPADIRDQVADLLSRVNLSPPDQFAGKLPHELSGGQLQRVSIARGLASRPRVLLADEPVSMLDVSIRLGVLNLLGSLVRELDLAMLYITHDIASARYFATTTLVMYAGQVIESGPSESVTQQPAHPYTQLLISSAPDPSRPGEDTALDPLGEPPSLVTPPSGCRFHPRCPRAMEICSTTAPEVTTLESGHWVRCWLFGDSSDH